MEQLINHSRGVVNANNVDTIYDWMDSGDILNYKLRSNLTLTPEESHLQLNLNKLIRLVSLEEDVHLYRGTNNDLLPTINAPQFNSLTNSIEIASNYGKSIMHVLVPKGTNALFISVWEELHPSIMDNEEKEIVLLPGKFVAEQSNYYKFIQD
jgi:hypothetical protein